MNICTNYPQIEEEEENKKQKEKPRGGCAAGVALLEKAKFHQKMGQVFWWIYQIARVREAARFIRSPLIAAFQWISWKLWNVVIVLCNVKPLIFNLINGAVGGVSVCLSLKYAVLAWWECEGGR